MEAVHTLCQDHSEHQPKDRVRTNICASDCGCTYRVGGQACDILRVQIDGLGGEARLLHHRHEVADSGRLAVRV